MGRAEEIFARIVDRGEEAIDEFIDTRTSEELFLDFKRSRDYGRGRVLHQNDRANFEKAVSGFGNSEGGVILWGVDCSRDPAIGDVASAKVPIEEPARFKSWLENATSGVTVPAHIGVRHDTVKLVDGTGFIVTLVPMSDHAPHQTAKDKRYYMRAGSSFLPVPHAVLAGMFGRRPNPHIRPVWTLSTASGTTEICVGITINLYNDGPGIAENVFINVKAASLPGRNCGLDFSNLNTGVWFGNNMPHELSVILKNGFRVPPEAFTTPAVINLVFRPPFNEQLRFIGSCGCSGSPTFPILTERDPTVIHDAFYHATDLLTTQYPNLASNSFEKRVFPNGLI
jgi:Putative DNA-binding domain